MWVSITVKSADTPSQNKVIQIGYDEDTGVTLFISVKGYSGGQYAIRTITFNEHTPHGQIKRIDGPRVDADDITTFEYYADTDADIFNRGMLYKVVNASGHRTEFGDYNHFGLPERIKDANNAETLLDYDARGRLTAISADGKTTVYAYDKTGNLKTVTPPGGKGAVTYDYTPANLTEYVYDQTGNHLKFGYDKEGNLVSEANYDSGSVMKRYIDIASQSHPSPELLTQDLFCHVFCPLIPAAIFCLPLGSTHRFSSFNRRQKPRQNKSPPKIELLKHSFDKCIYCS